MDYKQTIEYLYSQLPIFQNQGASAYKNNLNNTITLDDLYGNPHKQFKTIHVAGTNGKGSVSHMLAAILQSAGYKTGLYTSPHLKDFRERIGINGKMISKDEVVNYVRKYIQEKETHHIEPSFFELTVSMAFNYFANEKVDIAIVEVGMGGRLDSTNIITPEISVITNISLDHTQFLGNTLPLIAREKAGIIKSGIPVIIGEELRETKAVFDEISKINCAPINYAEHRYQVVENSDTTLTITNECSIVAKINPDLKGCYQKQNIATVFSCVDELKSKGFNISKEHIVTGIENTSTLTALRGRWQLIGTKPTIICDTGHNEAGIKQVVSQLSKLEYQKLHIVFGTVNDKNITAILKLLPHEAHYYFTQAAIARAKNAEELKLAAIEIGLKGKSYSNVQDALNAAKQEATINDVIFVGGSTFIVADVL